MFHNYSGMAAGSSLVMYVFIIQTMSNFMGDRTM